MYYIVETYKPFDKVSVDLESAVESNDFGILHVHDLSATLRSKGAEFGEECKIFEICNPKQAAKVLAADMSLNMVLPCRISVYTENGKTMIGFIMPTQILSALSRDPELALVAEEVEAVMIKILDEAK